MSRGSPAATSARALFSGRSLGEAAKAALQTMGAQHGGLITLYYGGSQKERDAQHVSEELTAAFPNAGVEYYFGGQRNVEYWISHDE